MTYKILVSDSLSEKGIKILKDEKDFEVTVNTKLTPEELKKEIKKYDALVVRSATKATAEIIESADNLKVIGRAGVGVDNVDVESATKKGIVVMNTPGGNTLSTAEQTIAMILALSRKTPQAYCSMKSGKWDRKSFMGTELNGKVLGIVGFGRIGKEVAKRMSAFGMEIVAYDPFASSDSANILSVRIVDDLNEIWNNADFITIHTPLTEETKYLFNKNTFPKLKNGVRIINCARGGIINEKDLCEALASGKVAGAALDVFENEPLDADSPLLKYENLILTPHLGASTEEAQENVAIDVAKQIVDMLKNGDIKNAVNFPSISPEELSRIKPYLGLSEKLGALLANLEKGRYTEINIEYFGEICDLNTMPLTTAIVQGLLRPILKDTVNCVNALSIAKERGIKITETKTKELKDFAHLISVVVKIEKGKEISISGTLFGLNDIRVVRINGFHVDASPEGHMLICENIDKPGFVGSIGTLLGANNINIASMTLGRKQKGEKALVVFNIDNPISPTLLEKIKKLEQIIDAMVIKL